MTILYNIAATSNSGGMERVLANKSNWLANNGYEVVVVTTDQRGRPSFFHMNESIRFYDLGIDYEENNGRSFLNKVASFPFKQVRHWRKLKAVINAINPDIVVSMFGNDAMLISGMHINARKVIELHFSKMKYMQYGRKGLWYIADLIRTKLDEYLVRKYDRFVVLTEEDKDDWGPNYRNMSVIPNALSSFPDRVSQCEKKIVVSIGRLSPQKGFDRLISVWERIAPRMPDWRLEIIGEGDSRYRAWLQQLVDSAGVYDSVVFRPSVNNMTEVYENASVIAITSRYEGLPMVLLESQAYGIPAVSFACKCGPKDVIEDGQNGFLVDDGNFDLFAERLEALMKDKELRQSVGARARNKSVKYAEDTVMVQWDKLFKGLVNSK